MTVVIKELLIRGKVDKSSQTTETEIIEIIDSKISEINSGNGLQETDKRQLIEECVRVVIKELESKSGY